MATKENKGGTLTNEQIEQDLQAKGREEGSYGGVQDTGDKKPLRTTHATSGDGNTAQNRQQDEEA